MPPVRLRAFDALVSDFPFVMPANPVDHNPECTVEHFLDLGGLPVTEVDRYVVDDQAKEYLAGERRSVALFNRVRVPGEDGAAWLDFHAGPKRTVGVLAVRTTVAELIGAPHGPGEKVFEVVGRDETELPVIKMMIVSFDGERVVASPWTFYVIADKQFITKTVWWAGETERLLEVVPEGPSEETILDMETALYALAVVDCTLSTTTRRKAPPAKDGAPTRLSAQKVRTGEPLALDVMAACFSPCGHPVCVAANADIPDDLRPKLAAALQRNHDAAAAEEQTD